MKKIDNNRGWKSNTVQISRVVEFDNGNIVVMSGNNEGDIKRVARKQARMFNLKVVRVS